MSSFSRQALENFVKTIDVNCERCLDIGGSQNPIKGRTKSWNVQDYKILDLLQPHEVKRQPDIVLDINEPIEVNQMLNEIVPLGKFDAVFCLEVSEYWYNPFEALKNISHFTKDKGILYISAHFIYPLHPPHQKDYLRYTKYGIEKLLEKTGFEIVDYIPRHSVSNGGTLYDYWLKEMMRFDRLESIEELTDIGCMIKAIKK